MFKNSENINQDFIKSSCLPQSKLYLKILDLPYYADNTNNPVTSELVERVIKKSHIFNDIILTLKPQIIKASFHSDSAVVWTNIWDLQSRFKAKNIIN